jgi:uncharacterized membrane protein YheB (UPF0754 family)
MSKVSDDFERFLYRIASRMVRIAISEDYSQEIDNKIGSYIDDYIKSTVIRDKLSKHVEMFLKDHSFICEVRVMFERFVDQELKQLLSARLEEARVGELQFTQWLTKVALKDSLTHGVVNEAIEEVVEPRLRGAVERVVDSEDVKESVDHAVKVSIEDSIRRVLLMEEVKQSLDKAVKSSIEDAVKNMVMNGLWSKDQGI